MGTQTTLNELVVKLNVLPERKNRLTAQISRLSEEISIAQLSTDLGVNGQKRKINSLEKELNKASTELAFVEQLEAKGATRYQQLKQTLARELAEQNRARSEARQRLINKMAVKYIETKNEVIEHLAFLIAYKAFELGVPPGMVNPDWLSKYAIDRHELAISAQNIYKDLKGELKA